MSTSKIKELHDKLVNKEISCVELTEDYLKRAEKAQEDFNCFNTISRDVALAQAQEVDEKIAKGEEIGILEGIPASIKDIFCTEGIETTGSSNVLKGFVPPYSATAYQKLRDAGMIILGKNSCDEFAQGGSNEHSAFGPVKNPVNPEYVPGGSSGGSAASVAADASVFSVGTDTGGSIRQPAAFTGTVGLKVTYGRVSRFGVCAMSSSYDTIGPITSSVQDAAIILEAIAGKDDNDSTTLDAEVPEYTKMLNEDISGLKIGLPKEYFAEGLDPAIKKHVVAAVTKLEEAGATVKEVSLPMTKYAVAVYYIITPAEVSANMSRYDGIRFGPTIENPEDLEDLYLQNRANGFGDEVKRRIMLGSYVLSHGYYDAYYKKAQKVRTKVIEEFENAFKEVDILVTPVTPTLPFKIGEHSNDPLAEYLGDAFTIPASCAGIPGLSLPCGKEEEFPVGIQLLGPQLSEAKLLNVGYKLEQLLD